MPRAIVTSGLSETIRSIRIQNKVQAKELAKHIGKSPAFISKLETGQIQTVDTDVLYSILSFISGEEKSQELADQIYRSLKLKYSAREIEEQLWFVNYDTIECLLPIPDALVDEMNSRIASLKITRQYLLSRINANEALSKEDVENRSIPYNQWYHQPRLDGNAHSIKIKLPESAMNRILDKEIDVAPYVFVFCILFYIVKIEQYSDAVTLSDEQNSTLMGQTTEILNSYKFLSISEKNSLIAEKQSQDEIQEILSSFDKDNIDILNDIILGFRFASEQNIKSTNDQLKAFAQNMHWDLGFMLKLISLEFCNLEKTSFSNKKALLSDISSLIQKYSELSDDQNRIESY